MVIQGYKDLNIQLIDQGKKKPKTLQLFRMVYCLDFPLNIVSLQRLKKRGIDQSHQYRILTTSRDTEPLKHTKKMYRQYILEYRPVSKTYTATVIATEAQRPSKQPSGRQSKDIRVLAQTSTDLWYKRLDYIGPLALSKVEENSLKMQLKGPSTTKYKDYVLSKICQQVSYRLNPNKFIKLFQKVYIDWFDLKEGWNDYQSDRQIIRRIVFIVYKATGYTFRYFTI